MNLDREESLEAFMINILERKDSFEFVTSRGWDIGNTPPNGEIRIHQQSILDPFGRADIILEWDNFIHILELKVNSIGSEDIAQALRYRTAIASWYPQKICRATVLTSSLIDWEGSKTFDPLIVSVHSGVGMVRCKLDEEGIRFHTVIPGEDTCGFDDDGFKGTQRLMGQIEEALKDDPSIHFTTEPTKWKPFRPKNGNAVNSTPVMLSN